MQVEKTCQDCQIEYTGHHASKWCKACKPNHTKRPKKQSPKKTTANKEAIQAFVADDLPSSTQAEPAQAVEFIGPMAMVRRAQAAQAVEVGGYRVETQPRWDSMSHDQQVQSIKDDMDGVAEQADAELRPTIKLEQSTPAPSTNWYVNAVRKGK